MILRPNKTQLALMNAVKDYKENTNILLIYSDKEEIMSVQELRKWELLKFLKHTKDLKEFHIK